MWRLVVRKMFIDVSEERTAYNLSVEKLNVHELLPNYATSSHKLVLFVVAAVINSNLTEFNIICNIVDC
jgi:hypothetical protein